MARLSVLWATTAMLLALAQPARAALPIEHWVAASGARVFFVRAPSIPMLDVRIDFDAGARFDPPDRLGLASLTLSMLAQGADGLDETEIAERFADVGARRGGGARDDRATVSLRTLTAPQEREAALALFARVLSAPDFPAVVLERERARLAQALREAAIRPGVIAARAFDRALFGEHPYGRSAKPETALAIERADLERFYRAHYGAGRAVVSMVGAISRTEAEAIAERLTSGLPPTEPAPSIVPVPRAERGQEIRIAHEATQSHILIGATAMRRDDPDYFALFVGNHVLGGGGFTSRLTNEVREKRGLAYSVYSYFSPGLHEGSFTVGLQTEKARTEQALSVVRDTLSAFLRNGPGEDELRAAKDNLIGGFALRLDSNAEILGHLSLIGFYDLGLDYLERWTDRVEAVSADDVRSAFARHLGMERMTTVVVGAGPNQ
ncbi:MAG: insulinase family protein [Burkholderiales bacterium]|nr:MAG: insulinase family protein [Burkholderiales bacterium]